MSPTAARLDEDVSVPAAAAVPASPFAASLPREAIRYFAASLVALALDAALLVLGVRALCLAPWFAGALSYAVGLVLVYVLSVRWVFARRVVVDRRREFAVFAMLGLVGLLLNSATLYVATSLGLALIAAKGLSAGVGFTANFISRKVLLFTAPAR